jgi:hypothetical protein
MTASSTGRAVRPLGRFSRGLPALLAAVLAFSLVAPQPPAAAATTFNPNGGSYLTSETIDVAVSFPQSANNSDDFACYLIEFNGAELLNDEVSKAVSQGNSRAPARTVTVSITFPATAGTGKIRAVIITSDDCDNVTFPTTGTASTESAEFNWTLDPDPVDLCKSGGALYIRSKFQDECDLGVTPAITLTGAATTTFSRTIDVRPENQDRYVRFAPQSGASTDCLSLPEDMVYTSQQQTVDITVGGANCGPFTNQQLRFTMLVYGVGDSDGSQNPEKQRTFVISGVTVNEVVGQDPQGPDSAVMSMSCSPEPQVNVTVTCTIVNGPVVDGGFDIIWEASYNPVFATGVVTLDGSGNGTFSFVIPAAAMGSMVGVQLVAHTGVMPLGMVTAIVPVSVPAGEGPSPLVPTSVLLASGLLLAGAGLRRRFALQG